jgi:mono/diheme cytochrome c family protein
MTIAVRRRVLVGGLVSLLALLGLGAAAWHLLHPEQPPARLASPQASATTRTLARGEYLARVGDCVACHSVPNGRQFAGGREMPTPFGSLFAPNITPDDDTGIGRWNADEFYRMMHTGISRDGSLLYPAMPFASYTRITRSDSDALFSYLQSVTPVSQRNRPHELRFPFNNRELLIGWRTLYFRAGEYQPDPHESAQWNRGAYLVQGLGHCALCHSAINALGGSSESAQFGGGMIPNQNWYAPSLTSNREAGLGDWPVGEIADLLQTGTSHHATTYGPMAEVVYDSLQYVRDDDAQAMAVYLKTLPRREAEGPPDAQARLVEPAVMELGRGTYVAQCAMCHGDDGKGQAPAYPPLAGNRSITMRTPVNSIRMVLNGGYAPGTARNPRPYGMPPFGHILGDDQVAAVVTYVRTAWGNAGTPVTAAQANELRKLLPE